MVLFRTGGGDRLCVEVCGANFATLHDSTDLPNGQTQAIEFFLNEFGSNDNFCQNEVTATTNNLVDRVCCTTRAFDCSGDARLPGKTNIVLVEWTVFDGSNGDQVQYDESLPPTQTNFTVGPYFDSSISLDQRYAIVPAARAEGNSLSYPIFAGDYSNNNGNNWGDFCVEYEDDDQYSSSLGVYPDACQGDGTPSSILSFSDREISLRFNQDWFFDRTNELRFHFVDPNENECIVGDYYVHFGPYCGPNIDPDVESGFDTRTAGFGPEVPTISMDGGNTITLNGMW
mgnify:CR=1 FL=1